jgi:hypothetical protein
VFRYAVSAAGQYRLDVGYQAWRGDAVQPVSGSPFTATFQSSAITNGPYSQVVGLPSTLYLDAGQCHNFTIVAKDAGGNLRLTGGDDYEVSYCKQTDCVT